MSEHVSSMWFANIFFHLIEFKLMIVQLLLSPSFCITAHLKAWMKTAIKNYWKSVLWINLKNNVKSVKFYFCKYGTNKENLDFDVLLFPIFFVAITVMLHKPALTPTQWYTQKNVLPFKLIECSTCWMATMSAYTILTNASNEPTVKILKQESTWKMFFKQLNIIIPKIILK